MSVDAMTIIGILVGFIVAAAFAWMTHRDKR